MEPLEPNHTELEASEPDLGIHIATKKLTFWMECISGCYEEDFFEYIAMEPTRALEKASRNSV